MIEKLFISKVRLKLLHIYLSDVDCEHHVRELVRMTDEEINAIRRELKNLEEAGILKSEAMLNKLVYRINPMCPIINELRSIFRKESPIVIELVKVIKEVNNINLAILTKNYFTNKYEDRSAVDILFVGAPDIKLLTEKMTVLEQLFNRQLRYTLISYDDLEFSKRKRDPFLLSILKEDKILLVGDEKDLI